MYNLVFLSFEFARHYLVRPAELFLSQLSLHQIALPLLHLTVQSSPFLLHVLQVGLRAVFTAAIETHVVYHIRNTHTQTKIQVFIGLRGSRTPHLLIKLNLATSHNLATPLPSRILPHNHTNIRTHAHTTPAHMSPTRTCTLMMVRGFS